MAPLPKRRGSSKRARVRTKAQKILMTKPLVCAACGKRTLPHKVCVYCGFYDGRAVLVKKEKTKVSDENKK